MKTYLRAIGTGKNQQPLSVDYNKDFMDNLNHEDDYFLLHYFWFKFKVMLFAFFDLGLCYGLSSLCSYIL